MADKQPERSVSEIEADLAATRSRLARSVDELAYRVSPDTIKANARAELDNRVQHFVGQAKGTVVTDSGEPQYENIAKALAGVAGVALTLGTLRRLFNRR